MNKKPGIGNEELEVLKFVADNAPITVRAAAEQYGEPRGLARTTILTVMDRLRKKGYLRREKVGGSFLYTAEHAKPEILKGLVETFVERTLAGSLSPFVAYLSENRDISTAELDELKKLVQDIDSERK